MLRVYAQGGTAILFGLCVVLFILQIESSKGGVSVDDDEDLSEVRLALDIGKGVLFEDEVDG